MGSIPGIELTRGDPDRSIPQALEERIARHDPARIFQRAEQYAQSFEVICSIAVGSLGLLAMPVFAKPQAVNIVQDPVADV